MITIAFYFLLCPGKYTGTTSDDTLFRLQEVELHVGDLLLDTMSPSSADLDATTTVSLTLTMQKNGTKGEVITHGLSTDPLACPVKSVVSRIHYLHLHNSKKSTPLASYFHYGKCVTVKANDITDALRLETLTTSHQTGLHPRDISTWSLRTG
jgi:hypothetical protein